MALWREGEGEGLRGWKEVEGGKEGRGKREEREQENSIICWDQKPEKGFFTLHPALCPVWEPAGAHEDYINSFSSGLTSQVPSSEPGSTCWNIILSGNQIVPQRSPLAQPDAA